MTPTELRNLKPGYFLRGPAAGGGFLYYVVRFRDEQEILMDYQVLEPYGGHHGYDIGFTLADPHKNWSEYHRIA